MAWVFVTMLVVVLVHHFSGFSRIWGSPSGYGIELVVLWIYGPVVYLLTILILVLAMTIRPRFIWMAILAAGIFEFIAFSGHFWGLLHGDNPLLGTLFIGVIVFGIIYLPGALLVAYSMYLRKKEKIQELSETALFLE